MSGHAFHGISTLHPERLCFCGAPPVGESGQSDRIPPTAAAIERMRRIWEDRLITFDDIERELNRAYKHGYEAAKKEDPHSMLRASAAPPEPYYYCAIENPLTIGGTMCLNPNHDHSAVPPEGTDTSIRNEPPLDPVSRWHAANAAADAMRPQRAAPPEPPRSIEAMAAEQGIGPITDATDLRIDLTDEEAAAFSRAIAPEAPVDVERLAEAIRNTYLAPSASRDLDADNIVAEYIRLGHAAPERLPSVEALDLLREWSRLGEVNEGCPLCGEAENVCPTCNRAFGTVAAPERLPSVEALARAIDEHIETECPRDTACDGSCAASILALASLHEGTAAPETDEE